MKDFYLLLFQANGVLNDTCSQTKEFYEIRETKYQQRNKKNTENCTNK